jgi:hypothetical protein
MGNWANALALVPTHAITVEFRVSMDISTGLPAFVVLAVVTYRIWVFTVGFWFDPW